MVLAACSQAEPGSPEPGTSTSSPASPSTSSSDTAGEVPKVDNPLDPSAYLNNPCKLVSQSDMASLGYTEPGSANVEDGGDDDPFAGPSCSWFAEGVEGIYVGIGTGNRDHGAGGLRSAYSNYQNGWNKYWEPTTINGYPAAFTDTHDFRSEGEYKLLVGIRDDLTIGVLTDGYVDDPDQAPEDIKTVAGMVIDTLKDGS